MSAICNLARNIALIATILGAFAEASLAGELDVTTSQFPRACIVGGELLPAFTLVNLNSQYSLGACSTNVTITGAGGAVVYNQSRDGIVVAQSATVPVAYTVPWVPLAPGSYIATVYANSAANVRGPQIKTISITVTALVPCPEEPILMTGDVLYLGTASSGMFTYSAGGSSCCFVIRPHIVTGHGVINFAGGQVPRTVSGSAPSNFAIGVDRDKAANMSLVIRLDWRKCDNTSSGSDYITIKLGAAPAPDVSIAAPIPGTMANTPNATETADPVNALTGEFFTRPITDLLLDAHKRLPLEITRSYASNMHATGIPSSGFGDYWTHRYAYHMSKGTNEMYIHSPAGRQYRFAWTGSAYRLDYPNDFPYKLEMRGADYAFFDPQAREIWRFDTAARLPRSVDDIHGYRLRFEYTGGWMSKITNPFGRSATITRDTAGLITRISDGTRDVTYSYSGRLLASVTNPMNGVTRYEYTSNAVRGGFLTRIVLPKGNAHLTNAYDSSGRVVSQTDALGNVTRMNYNGAFTSVTLPGGASTRYEHNTKAELIAMTDALDNETVVRNDAGSHRTGYVDRLGGQHANTYAASGNIASRTAADGSTVVINDTAIIRDGFTVMLPARFTMSGDIRAHVSYDTAARVIGFSDFGGEFWTYRYDNAGNLTRTTSPLGATTNNTYDAFGNRTQTSATGRGATSFMYTPLGHLARTTRPDGTQDHFVVDMLNRLTQSTTAAGVATRVYDANSNVIESSIGGAPMKFLYDEMDRLITAKDDADKILHSWTYTPNGQIAASTDQSGVATSFNYNANGWRIGSNDAVNGAWTTEYDDEGAVTGINGPEDMQWSISYDAMGRPMATTNTLGATTTQTFTALGLPLTQTTPSGTQRAFTYEGMHVTGSSIRGMQIGAGFEYGRGDLIAKITDPIGGVWSYGRDTLGRVTSMTAPNGHTTRFAFDTSGRLATMTPPGSGAIAFRYGAGGSSTTMRSGTDSMFAYSNDTAFIGSNVSLKFNKHGNLVSSNQLTIKRDASGRFAGVGYNANEPSIATTYNYDTNGRVVTLIDWWGLRTTFGYDDAGRRTLLERPNGTSVRTEYDAAGHVTLIDEGVVGSIRLTYNVDGKVETVTRAGHLNPTSNNIDRSWTYDSASHVNGYVYDSTGNFLSDGRRRVRWNVFNQPTTIIVGDTTVDFSYDWFSNPVRVDSSACVMNYAYPTPQPDMIVGTGDNTIIVRDPNGLPLYQYSQRNGAQYFSLDNNGSPVALTDSTGAVLGRRAFSPLGEIVGQTGEFDTRLAYTGQLNIVGEFILDVNGQLIDPSAGRSAAPWFEPNADPRSLNPMNRTRLGSGAPLSRAPLDDMLGDYLSGEIFGRTFGPNATAPSPSDADRPASENVSMAWALGDLFGFPAPRLDVNGQVAPQMPPPGATDAPRETPKSVKPSQPAPAPTAGGATTTEPPGPIVAPTPPVHVEPTAPTVRRQRYTLQQVIDALRSYHRGLRSGRGRDRSEEYYFDRAERFMDLTDEVQDSRMRRWNQSQEEPIEAPKLDLMPDNPDAPDGGSILDEIEEVLVPC